MILAMRFLLRLCLVLLAAHHILSEALNTNSRSDSSSTIISNEQNCKSTLLPDLSSGGLVFFLHIPKTGGTSIRRNVEKFDHIEYVFAKNYSTYWDTVPFVENLIIRNKNNDKSNRQIINKNNTILFYEIHATTAPSFYQLRKRLRRWRETALRNNVPVFFFTLLRSSVPYALSHFNFFHVDQRNPTFEECDATEENFVRLSLKNPQCQFLWKGENSMRGQKAKNVFVTSEECDLVQSSMMDLLDWVGTTEGLSNETLPLLRNLLKLPENFVFETFRVTSKVMLKKEKQYFGLENLTLPTVQSILDMSSLDMNLYENAKQNFPVAMWTDNVLKN